MKNTPPSPDTPLRIGTRGSPLALAQAEETRSRLCLAHRLPKAAFEIVAIRTTGDRVQDRPLAKIGGKGLFTKEIEDALLAGTIDMAVHSMKDVPTEQPKALAITCILPREDVRDAFICDKYANMAELPIGAIVGSSSLRRKAQLLFRRPDLRIVEFRGNVQTRLSKLALGSVDATLLAMAGLNRLGVKNINSFPIQIEQMLPAVAQGAIGVEQRLDDDICRNLLMEINHADSYIRVMAERAFLAILEGSCQTPIAGLAEYSDDKIRFYGEIIRPDGSECHADELSGPMSDAILIGIEVATRLKKRAGSKFF